MGISSDTAQKQRKMLRSAIVAASLFGVAGVMTTSAFAYQPPRDSNRDGYSDARELRENSRHQEKRDRYSAKRHRESYDHSRYTPREEHRGRDHDRKKRKDKKRKKHRDRHKKHHHGKTDVNIYLGDRYHGYGGYHRYYGYRGPRHYDAYYHDPFWDHRRGSYYDSYHVRSHFPWGYQGHRGHGGHGARHYHGYSRHHVSVHHHSHGFHHNGLAGALLGGLIGGVIGAEIDGGHHRTGGAVAGAAVGAAIGVSAVEHDHGRSHYAVKSVSRADYQPSFTKGYPEGACISYKFHRGEYICTKRVVSIGEIEGDISGVDRNMGSSVSGPPE